MLYREQNQNYLNHLIPLVEDHDNGLPISHPSIALMIYVLTEFYSRTSTFIYHGCEQTGVRTVNRPRIHTINEWGDIVRLVVQLEHRILPYRISQQTHTVFHIIEQDFLLSEKRLKDERSLFLAMNKSTLPRLVDLPLEHLYRENLVIIENILQVDESQAEVISPRKILRLLISSFSFLIIGTRPLRA